MRRIKLFPTIILLVLIISSCGGKYAEVQKEIDEYQELTCLSEKGVKLSVEKLTKMREAEAGSDEMNEANQFTLDFIEVQGKINARTRELGEVLKEYGADMSEEEKKEFGLYLLASGVSCGSYEEYMKSVLENDSPK